MGVFNYSEECSGGELEKKRENRDDPSNRQTEEKNREREERKTGNMRRFDTSGIVLVIYKFHV